MKTEKTIFEGFWRILIDLISVKVSYTKTYS